MNDLTKGKLFIKLEAAIQSVLEDSDLDLSTVGNIPDGAASLMAKAAIIPLEAIEMLDDYNVENDKYKGRE